MRVLLWMMGAALVLMWALGLVFRIPGVFVWFLLGFGIISLSMGFLAREDL